MRFKVACAKELRIELMEVLAISHVLGWGSGSGGAYLVLTKVLTKDIEYLTIKKAKK
jgi:hypothetical protein